MAQPAPARQWFVGVSLVAAAVTHLLLAFAGTPEPGWLWLVIPATAGAAGLLFIGLAGSDS